MRSPTLARAPGGPAVEARALAGSVARGGPFDPAPPAYRPPVSPLADAGHGRKRTDRETFALAVARDGTPRLRDKPSVRHLYGPVFSFDVTDWAMRQAGIDPYAYEKRKLLEDTREERAQMALAARGEDLREAERRLPELLARVWRARGVRAGTRRELLFLLWDECAEDGHPDVVAAGARARAIILAFVRRRLPAGGPDAFTPDELARLNRTRTSRPPFAPY